MNPKKNTHIWVRILLDSRCSRDLIRMVVVIGLELDLLPKSSSFSKWMGHSWGGGGTLLLTRLKRYPWGWDNTGKTDSL